MAAIDSRSYCNHLSVRDICIRNYDYEPYKTMPDVYKRQLIGGNCTMAIQIGINGFGRIGRVAFRIAISQPERFHLCGINVRNADLDYMVYMIRYDTIFGRFRGELGTYEKGDVYKRQDDGLPGMRLRYGSDHCVCRHRCV